MSIESIEHLLEAIDILLNDANSNKIRVSAAILIQQGKIIEAIYPLKNLLNRLNEEENCEFFDRVNKAIEYLKKIVDNNQKQPSRSAIRELLKNALSDDDFLDMCQDNFPDVHKQFTEGQTKAGKIRILLDYVERQRKVSELLQEIAKINPRQYAEFLEDSQKSRLDKELL
jgi:tetratricopeptide (TPR) repeat protein